MATKTKHEDAVIIEVNAQEATNIIGLLAAQLGKVALCGNASGACPAINITNEYGIIEYRLVMTLK